MAKSIHKNMRFFFWLRKKETRCFEVKHLQDIKKQSKSENVTIASFWQTQLMNIAQDSNIKK